MYQTYKGTTLMELVIAIVIISVSFTGIISALMYTARSSSDPMIRQQAIAIAQAYMEEILSKDFPSAPSCSAPVGNRSTYTSVCDYNVIGTPTPEAVSDQNGNVINELSNYTVKVDVLFNTYSGLGNNAVRVDVTVLHDILGSVMISGYRSNY